MPTSNLRGKLMSRYRRLKIERGTLFFTLTLGDRGADLLVCHIERLRRAYAAVQTRRPFETVAICILPDHIHALWQLPHAMYQRVTAFFGFAAAFSNSTALAMSSSTVQWRVSQIVSAAPERCQAEWSAR